jgi:hypothetical protein
VVRAIDKSRAGLETVTLEAERSNTETAAVLSASTTSLTSSRSACEAACSIAAAMSSVATVARR